MVHVFYYKSISRLPQEPFQYYLQELPSSIQKKVLSFKHWQDAERSLAGNILLLKGLEQLDISGYTLSQIKLGEFNKPFFDDALHFNISHSGSYTICAISQQNKVGIDVEEIKEIPLTDFTEFFYDQEWQDVLKSSNSLLAFYTLWTKKEAFLKLIGSGLNVPLNTVVIKNNVIRWNNEELLLQRVELDDPTHICYLCSNFPQPSLTLTAIDLQRSDY